MGGVPWQVTVYGPSKANPVPADPCFMVSVLPSDDLGAGCTDLSGVPAAELSSGRPAVFAGVSDSVTEATVGVAAADVTYFTVTFTDGQQLKLVPLTFHGQRYVAWVAPLSMAVARVVAHLGTAQADNGQTATAVPFNSPGQAPVFGAWQKPGEPVPARANGVIGHGTTASHQAWSATADTGPWGSCVVVNGHGLDCIPLTELNTVALLGPVLSSVPGLQVVIGAAPAGTAKITVTLADGKSVTALPVTVGNYHLFAAAAGTSAAPTGWSTYDAAGHQTGFGAVGSFSAHQPATS
jgi:hypothetical protein